MKNMAAIISSQNWQVLKPSVSTCDCNCKDRNGRSLENKIKTP